MEQHAINELITKYNEGLTDPAEIRQLEELIEQGVVPLTALQNLSQFDEFVKSMADPSPSMELDNRIYRMLKEEKQKSVNGWFSLNWPNLNFLLPRLAFGLVVLIAGFAGGYLINRPAKQGDMVALTKEVTDLKELMMLTLLEKESATDRLKAVSLTNDMAKASQNVTRALIQTLNQDGNVNVRLAALDALRPYAYDSKVRESLIKSIANQSSPMVQIALAQLMVELQEKKSIKELQKLLQEESTPKEVKERIEESIQVLI